MRRQRGLIRLIGLAALVGVAFVARPAVAAVTTEQSASILIFPKVIADGARDTIIQITNTSNSMRHAHCFYVNGAPTIPGQPPGGFICKGGALNGLSCNPRVAGICGDNAVCEQVNPPLCTEIDFDIWLTKQQPTHWVVSTGRLYPSFENTCRVGNCDTTSGPAGGHPCCDAGLDPGRVPPVVPGFTGELKCIEVDAGGAPLPGNSLKGEATLEEIATGDVSKYNAIGLKGLNPNNMDNVLCLGHGGGANCPGGPEYEGCPATWILDHNAVGADDLVVREGSSVGANLTVVPCTENFELQSTPAVTLQFSITNEFEQTFSASTTLTCWASLNLETINPIFQAKNLQGSVVQTRMRAAASTPVGVTAVIEETHTVGAVTARSAQNGHTTLVTPSQEPADIITIPAEQLNSNP